MQCLKNHLIIQIVKKEHIFLGNVKCEIDDRLKIKKEIKNEKVFVVHEGWFLYFFLKTSLSLL